MPEVVIRIPEDIGNEFNEVKPMVWQLIVDRTINRELERIRSLKRSLSKSKLTEEDAKEISDEVSEALAKRYLKLAGLKG